MKKNLTLLLLPILLVSCLSKANKDVDASDMPSEASENTAVKGSGVEVGVGVVGDKVEDEWPEVLTFSADVSGDTIKVLPNSPYLNDYQRGEEFEFPDDVEVLMLDDEVRVPTIRLYIVNNSEQDISTENLEINVESSVLDDFPYMHISSSTSDYTYMLQLRNDSWVDWGSATLEYRLLKKGERFDGKYDRQKKIPYFKEIYFLSFYDDLKSMGFDVNELIKNTEESSYDEISHAPVAFAWSEDVLDPKWFSPFDYQKARLYGRMTFEKTKHTIRFRGNIPLMSLDVGGGASEMEDEVYGVLLREQGKNYSIKYPYTTIIKAGGNEIVDLNILCTKSTKHVFRVNVNNDNGLTIQTKPIFIHYLYPRNCRTVQEMVLRQYNVEGK